ELFEVSTSRVRPDPQAKIKRYRHECYRVPWEASAGVVDKVETVPSTSIVALEQIEMEQRLTTRLDRAAQAGGDIQRRLSVVERKLRPSALYRRFEVTSYKNIRLEQYERILQLHNGLEASCHI